MRFAMVEKTFLLEIKNLFYREENGDSKTVLIFGNVALPKIKI